MNDDKAEMVSVPAGLLHPECAHLWTDGQTIDVYLEGDLGWVHVVPVHRTIISATEVAIARKHIRTLDFIDHNKAASPVSDGWL